MLYSVSSFHEEIFYLLLELSRKVHESLALKSLDVRLHHGSLANFGAIINGKFYFSDLGFVRGATHVGDTCISQYNFASHGVIWNVEVFYFLWWMNVGFVNAYLMYVLKMTMFL